MPQDSTWGSPQFSNCDVLSVLETAFDAKVQPVTQTLHGNVSHTKQVSDATRVRCSSYKQEHNRRRKVMRRSQTISGLCPFILPHKDVNSSTYFYRQSNPSFHERSNEDNLLHQK